ncbi:MAG: hypothetical protein WD825_06040 [Gemmatimonadaceae bacterium]
MSRLLQVRLAIAIIGIVIWAYGVAADEAQVRLVGIILLATSLVLRFTPKRFQRNEDSAV